jgi:autophagy-related protein 2
VLVFGSSHSPQDAVHVKTDGAELEIDEDYFSRPVVGKDSFPFSGEPFLGSFRLKLVDFSVSIKLVDGHGFSRRHPQSAEATPLMHSFGMSPLSPAALSTAPSARWSESATRPAEDAVEMVLDRINCEVDWGQLGQEDGPTEQLMHEDGTAGGPEGGLMALRLVIRKVEILDQVRASRWKTILTRRLAEEEESPLRDELGGLLEESMVRCELSAVQVAGPEEALRAEDRVEYRLKVRLLPLRVHLDQDALRFASRFLSSFAAADGLIDEPDQVQVEPLFFQHCDIAEIRVRLDYKPKRVDLCRVALGRFAELLNLFQLEDAELALPAVRLRGVKGARQFTADLVRAWLPFVKGRQIPRMLHGIGPVRTVVNLGSGLSDLILLPMHHYQRDGRLIRGLRKGASSFLHATALEGARLGSRLAVGTQVVLEHVDDIFEGSSSDAPPHGEQRRLAGQPEDVREGLLEAYQSLATSLEGALQTIVAVPVQVYERSGPSGALKAVIRAVPIAVLRPMIGASEAVGRTLMGIENSMDASRGVEIGQKYKRAG